MNTWRTLRSFACYLATLNQPPRTAGQLTPTHLAGWYQPRRQLADAAAQLGQLKRTLRHVDVLGAQFLAALNAPNPPTPMARTHASYSRAETQRILNAARRDVRAATTRIRGNRERLRRWRNGELHDDIELARTGELLDYVDQHLDVPRYTRSTAPLRWVAQRGTVEDHLTALHLSGVEAAAFAVLLAGLTGHNKDSLVAASATHHRPDGYTGGTGTAIIALDKPRRGTRRHMDVPLTSTQPPTEHDQPLATQDHIDAEHGGLDLHSPFGVYTLLVELAAPGRRHLDTDRLFAWYCPTGGGPARPGRGLRTHVDSCLIRKWARRHDLPVDPGEGRSSGAAQLSVSLRRLRLTYLELAQRPVAHADSTLANEYLARNRGNLAEYQQVVAAALREQVSNARARARMQPITEQEVAESHAHPERVAARHRIDTATLRGMLAGELDTVLGACIDHTHSPHATPGQPCRASFMLCLSCPCARALPSHLPVQVRVHDELERRRAAVTPLRWAQRFAVPYTQLSDLLDRAGTTAVSAARNAITAAERELVDRFLARELDHQ